MVDTRSPFPPSYFAQLAEIESSNWWFRSRNRLLLWILHRKIGKFENFLEVGCGTGFVLECIAKSFPYVEISGAEYYEEGLEFAKTRIPSANFKKLDITKMSDRESYDVIGAFDVIEHIEEDQKSLINLAHALKPTGKLIISVPQHQWLWSATDEASCHVRRYSSKELSAKLQAAGLKIDYQSSFISLLLPLMVVSRKRSSNVKVDPMEELKMSKALNLALETIMSLELFLLRVGVRFPFGGSLLIVASKH